MKFVCDKHKNLGIGLTIQFKGGVYETDDQEKIKKLTGNMAEKWGIVMEGGEDNLGTPYVVFEVDENAEGKRPQVTAVIEGPAETEEAPFSPEDAVVTDEEREALEATPAEDGDDGDDAEVEDAEAFLAEQDDEAGDDEAGEVGGDTDEADIEAELLQMEKDEIESFARTFGIELDKRNSVKNMVKAFMAARAKMTEV
ncbi:MAG: hypothetical protein AB7D39_17685 [Pseudodesulfovibrio sp.]|uniref:hypothetical protein n=1 Tax=Pseudodesulfovibrio sp. TaxID=2035812 RepID=UPI003D0A86E1